MASKDSDPAAEEAASEEPRKRGKKTDEAPFGFDVVGEDGRRIHRGLSEREARQEAHRISSVTGEDIDVVPAENSAPSVLGPAPTDDSTPLIDTLVAPEHK